MATTIGFKRATIFVYNDDDSVKDTFVVEGNSNEGGNQCHAHKVICEYRGVNC